MTAAQTDRPGLVSYRPPTERLSADEHLILAAECRLGSDAEKYHLAAATTEALLRIAVRLENPS